MFRRRRRHREIPFSFDSFLDVVANVVGIIIRLILVAWVGARSYNSVQELLKEKHAHAAATSPLAMPADPLELELNRHRQDLADAQARLLEQLRQLGDVKDLNGLATSLLAAQTQMFKTALDNGQ